MRQERLPEPAPAATVQGNAPGRRLGYQPQLDGVRAVAVLAVVAAHTGAPLFEAGSLGVDIFFVLSGFLITTLLVQEFDNNKRISLRHFYIRRALRLLPALVTVCVFTAVTFAIFRPFRADNTLIGVPASLFYVSSWLEEHFYLIWPVLIILVCRYFRPQIQLWVGGIFAVAVVYRALSDVAGATANRLYNSPDMRAEQLLGGCILAVLLINSRGDGSDRWRKTWGALCAASAVVLAFLVAVPNRYYSPRFDNGNPSTYYYNGVSTLITIASAVIIGHLTLWPASSMARLLSLRPLVWLGRRSYAVYLWHVPLFGLFFLPGQPDLLRFGVRILLIPATFAIAWASFRYIEAPILARRPRAANSKAWQDR
ncbi:MAG: acyltransferase [Actinobacteria bacterium]|nr:acyltransferase [Actinomycetota bacterium]